MDITRAGSQPSTQGPADWFTGAVRIDREGGATELHVGDHLAFSSSQRYSYTNIGESPARFVRIVVS